jgi:hypothetical protein
MEISCNGCSYKLEKRTSNKYNNPKVQCTKRKCMVQADEAQWCKFYNESRSEVLKTS